MRKKSILDISTCELINMDIDKLRISFINEINELSFFSEEERTKKIKSMLVNLFRLQPTSDMMRNVYLYEHRLYAYLINIPEFYNNVYIRDFLSSYVDNYFEQAVVNKSKIILLKRIFDYLDSGNEKIDKFNYVFRSSANIGIELLVDEDGHKFKLMGIFLDYFDKEECCQICNFLFNNYGLVEECALDKFLDKKIFIISMMVRKIKTLVGSSNNFLEKIYLCRSVNFDSILVDFYDKFVGEKVNEELFKSSIFDNHNLDNLIEGIISTDFKVYSKVSNFDDFIGKKNLLKRRYHDWILDLDKYESGNFDKNRDFRVVKNNEDIVNFKHAFLYNVFGMKMSQVSNLIKFYGNYLKETFDDSDECDKEIFFILKVLYDINRLSFKDKDCLEKIRFLQLQYLSYLDKYGLNNRKNTYSSVVLDVLFSKMFINTYNKRLFDSKKGKVLFYDSSVPVIDASNKFCMMITSFCGSYGRYYDENINMASKWNTAFNSRNQGISCSCITNENLGSFSLAEPMVGFGYIPTYALSTMGVCDIYTTSENFNLRSSKIEDFDYKKFVPGCIIDNETRYGYNEFLIDRFLMDDKDNVLKLQPNYVVYYKFDDNYKESRIYKSSLKLAKDFNIPIVMVDVSRVKEHEKKEILALEDELFSGDDPKKMEDILVRYMNNYTGSLVLQTSSDGCYGKDFSIEGMGNFFDKIFNKIDSINDIDLRNIWINSLEDSIALEKKKYSYARGARSYNHSVSSFVLEKYDLEKRIFELKNDLIGNKKVNNSESILVDVCGKIIGCDEDKCFTDEDYDSKVIKVEMPGDKHMIYLRKNDYAGEIETIVSFTKMLGLGSDFQFFYHNGGILDGKLIRGRYNRDISLSKIENLVMSYFFECEDNIIDDLISSDFKKKPSFKCTDSFSLKVDDDLDDLNSVIEKIESITNEEFLKLFGGVIDKYSKEINKSFESIACSLLDKKKNIREVFDSLSKSLEKHKANVKK